MENEAKEAKEAEFKSPLLPVFKSPEPLEKTLTPTSEASPIQKTSQSPAEIVYKDKAIPIPYKAPPWAGLPPDDDHCYNIEEIKNGTIVATHKLAGKSYFVVGRLPGCDIMLEHPSLSRFHAVLQFKSADSSDKPVGFYLYDLDSTHGTFHNKNRCFPKTYYRLRVGHALKFGLSTRLLILQGPQTDMEDESDLTVSELKAIAAEKAKKKAEEEEKARLKANPEPSGVSWGMTDDDLEEKRDDEQDEEMPDMEKNPFATTGDKTHEKLYINDPKKFLKAWFEQEGYDDLDFKCTDKGYGSFHCKIDLPIDVMGTGESVAVAEVTHKGKKKDAIAQCALEACRLLDKYGVLSASHANQESEDKKRARKWEENDFYSSDEDEYLDRTSNIKEKREKRKKLAQMLTGSKSEEKKVETFESLTEKVTQISTEISSTEKELKDAQESLAVAKSLRSNTENDDLDSYMAALSKTDKGEMDEKEKISKLKQKLNSLKQELNGVNRLLDIARPTPLPDLKPLSATVSPAVGKSKFTGVMIGKRKGSGVATNLRTIEQTNKQKLPDLPTVSLPAQVFDSNARVIQKETKKVETKNEEEVKKVKKEEKTEEKKENIEKKEDITMETDEIKEQTVEKLKPKREEVKPKPNVKPVKPKVLKPAKLRDDSDESDEPMEEFEEEKEVWVPPKDQSGDGRTTLNDKFGY